MALTTKERAFAEHYLANGFNGTQAAISAGYSQKNARAQASRMLAKANIRQHIEARMGELAMSAAEAMLRLSQQAAASMEDFLDVEKDAVSLAKAERAGKLHLIKKFTHHIGKETETISIELYDAQAALVQILKELHLRHGEPTERMDVDDSRARDARDKLERALARIAERNGSESRS